MPQPKPKALIESTLFGLAALCLMLGIWALGFFQDISREDRALLILVSSSGLLASFGGLVLIRYLWKWLLIRAGQKVLAAWRERLHSTKAPTIDVAHYLSEGELRILALQLFRRIGFRILNRDDEEDQGYIRMINPEGQLELVACQQQIEPIEIQSIYEFLTNLKQAGAVHGYFWAAGGFTPESVYWARQKPILLVDRYGIGHLIDCVQIHHSLFID